jgi:starch synthase (maltosyl-transferring)
MIVYNLFPLLAGTFPNWVPHIERAAAMRFDWIFTNPVQRPGASGSIYSIADGLAINPALVEPTDGRSAEDQLRAVLRIARERGLRAMVDLVINHCAYDSQLVTDHPAWFRRDADGAVSHAFCWEDGRMVVWEDLAQFDYSDGSDPEGLYRYCLSMVEYLLGLGFEGFRCDAAYSVPAAVWRRLIDDVKSRSAGTVFVAETLGCTTPEALATARVGFDYVFNNSKWWDFRSPWLLQQYHLMREVAATIGFPESHDTPRLAQEMGGNPHGLKLRYLFAALSSSGCMMPIGFEFGFRRPLDVVSSRPADWESTTIDLRDFICSVNAAKAAHPVLREETPILILPSPDPHVLVIWKASASAGQEALLFLNTDRSQRHSLELRNLRGELQLGRPLVDVSPEFRMDAVPEQPFTYDFGPGQSLVLVTSDRPESL